MIFLCLPSTFYAAFYSFYSVFLHVNDIWYQLMPIQLAFTSSDIYVWAWMIGRIKYNAWPKGTVWGKACVLINKLAHFVFNMIQRRIFGICDIGSSASRI